MHVDIRFAIHKKEISIELHKRCDNMLHRDNHAIATKMTNFHSVALKMTRECDQSTHCML